MSSKQIADLENFVKKGVQGILVVPNTMNSNSPPTTPAGTITRIGYNITDASCDSTVGGSSYNPSGTVTITAITATNITGSYDIVVFDGQHLTGNFDVAICPSLNSLNICGLESGDLTGTCNGTSQCL